MRLQVISTGETPRGWLEDGKCLSHLICTCIIARPAVCLTPTYTLYLTQACLLDCTLPPLQSALYPTSHLPLSDGRLSSDTPTYHHPSSRS